MNKYGEPDQYGDFPYLYSGKYNLSEVLEERLPEYFDMQLVDPDEIEVLVEVVNQGIDSHLEAVTTKESHKYVDVKAGDKVICKKLEFIPDKAGMKCLIRRLIEYINTSQDDIKSEAAYMLTSSILESLQIEFSL